jgi:integrase/recombinase XerD
MKEEELGRVRALIAQFQHDRKVEGYSRKVADQNEWGLWYFLDFLKGRDEGALTEVTAETLHRFQLYLYDRPGRRAKVLSLMSQMHSLVAVRVFFRWLAKRGHVLADPAAGVALPRQKKPLPRGVMTRREVERLLAQPNVETPLGLRDRAMLELLYSSGLRSSELRGLTLYDVNTGEGEVLVREGKGGKDRVAPVGDVAAKYVELYVKEARPKILGGKEDPGWLFLGRTGRKLDAVSLNRHIIQRYALRAGLKTHVTTHGFRHTCATHLLKGRASLRHIQALLGHKSLESTQIYTRVEAGDLKRELRRCHPREKPHGGDPHGGDPHGNKAP